MFDTGAHLFNTVTDLVGEPFAQVAAFIDKRKTKVDILTVAIAKTKVARLSASMAAGIARYRHRHQNLVRERHDGVRGVGRLSARAEDGRDRTEGDSRSRHF